MPSALPDRTPPPPREEIDRLPPFAGGGSLRLDLTDMVIDLEGLPQDLARRAATRYGPYARPADGRAPDLHVRVHDAGREHFIRPDDDPRGRLYRLSIAPEPGGLRLVAHGFGAWFRVGEARGALALCQGTFDPPERALENFLRACVAWIALERGGFLLHSASIVRHGRAFLFFGASGAGKSTLSALDTEGQVVSDDLSLVLPDPDGRPRVIGSPFRGTYTGGEPMIGRFPLHSAYRLRQDADTFVLPMSPGAALAALTANLTFVVDLLGLLPDLAPRLGPRLRRIPTYELHFRKEPGFWRALEAFHGDLG